MFIGICEGWGNPVCKLQTGDDVFQISKIEKKFYTLLNNRAIMASSSEKEFINRSLPVLITIISTLFNQNKFKNAKLALMRKVNGKLEAILKMIRENLEAAKIFVLEIHPDEIQENKPKQAGTTENYAEYYKHIMEVSRNTENIRHLSEIILRTRLAKNMWGSKEVMTVLSRVKLNMAEVNKLSDLIDSCIEHSETVSRHARQFMHSSSSQAKVVIGKAIDDFSTIKTYLSEIAQNLYPLYNIDQLCINYTGYPATWFIMSSILMDFMYEFETLLANIIRSSVVEATVIEPMLAWKIGTTGTGA